MSGAKKSLEEVVGGLRDEGLLDEAQVSEAEAQIASLQAAPPWYVRAMVGFGAWLASLLLIGFIAGFGFMVGGYLILGLALIGAALALRRQSDNDFLVQATLAASLAGQVFLVWGIAGESEAAKVACTAVMVVSGVLFFIFPDRIHRVLSILFAASALVLLIYLLEWNVLVPVLGPMFAAALVGIHRHRSGLTAAGFGHLVRPLEEGLVLAAFACLMLSTVYLLPVLDLDSLFYPRPWISTLLLGAVWLYVGSFTLQPLLTDSIALGAPAGYALMLVLIACCWAAPGIVLALIVTLLGAAAGQRAFAGAGIGFLLVFVAAYFYGMETTMLTKSITLVATGTAVLVARWVVAHLLTSPQGGPAHD